jgi:hypothetical protein
MLRLILDPEGAAIDVDDTMLTGACATQLAAQLGYPLLDSAGRPVISSSHRGHCIDYLGHPFKKEAL